MNTNILRLLTIRRIGDVVLKQTNAAKTLDMLDR